MATISPDRQETLEIPGAYLDDVRSAALWMCEQYVGHLRKHHDELLKSKFWDAGVDPEKEEELVDDDWPDAKSRMSLLTKVFGAEDDMTITAPAWDLTALLGTMNQRLTERLLKRAAPSEEPVMFLEGLEALRWATSEFLRLDPPVAR